MIALLDANVLIALGDADHTHAEAALSYFSSQALPNGWATCPLTENAFLRVFGNPSYPGGPGSTAAARRVLLSITANPGHQFWEDDLSLTEADDFPQLPTSRGLTDIYLLALAVKRRALFATFDRRIDSALVPGGKAAYHVVA